MLPIQFTACCTQPPKPWWGCWRDVNFWPPRKSGSHVSSMCRVVGHLLEHLCFGEDIYIVPFELSVPWRVRLVGKNNRNVTKLLDTSRKKGAAIAPAMVTEICLQDWARDFSTPAAPAPACDLVDPPSYWMLGKGASTCSDRRVRKHVSRGISCGKKGCICHEQLVPLANLICPVRHSEASVYELCFMASFGDHRDVVAQYGR